MKLSEGAEARMDSSIIPHLARRTGRLTEGVIRQMCCVDGRGTLKYAWTCGGEPERTLRSKMPRRQRERSLPAIRWCARGRMVHLPGRVGVSTL